MIRIRFRKTVKIRVTARGKLSGDLLFLKRER
jgi:hypothetical protein